MASNFTLVVLFSLIAGRLSSCLKWPLFSTPTARVTTVRTFWQKRGTLALPLFLLLMYPLLLL